MPDFTEVLGRFNFTTFVKNQYNIEFRSEASNVAIVVAKNLEWEETIKAVNELNRILNELKYED